MSTNKDDWGYVKVSIPREWAEDLQAIKQWNGSNISDQIRPMVRKHIEEYTPFLKVGSKRESK